MLLTSEMNVVVIRVRESVSTLIREWSICLVRPREFQCCPMKSQWGALCDNQRLGYTHRALKHLGVWRNWQTRQIQDLVSLGRAGSIPVTPTSSLRRALFTLNPCGSCLLPFFFFNRRCLQNHFINQRKHKTGSNLYVRDTLSYILVTDDKSRYRILPKQTMATIV